MFVLSEHLEKKTTYLCFQEGVGHLCGIAWLGTSSSILENKGSCYTSNYWL